jgi:hypothetical protein
VELGNLALDLLPTREAAPPPLLLVAGPTPVALEPPLAPSTPPTLEPAPAPAPTLTLVPPADAVARTPAHHAVPPTLPVRLVADVAGWAGFAVVVVWVVIVSAGHGVASASAWAGSLFGLVVAATAVLTLIARPRRAPGSGTGRED